MPLLSESMEIGPGVEGLMLAVGRLRSELHGGPRGGEVVGEERGADVGLRQLPCHGESVSI